jgi:predicted hydrocarbon binding protein
MLGVFESSLEDYIREFFGETVWASVSDQTRLEDVQSTLSEKQRDSESFAILYLLAEHLQQPVSQTVRTFGKYLLPRLMQFMPEAREADMNFRDFIISVDRVIHKEVERLYPNANVPKMDFIQQANQLTLFYRSERRLCYLAEGLIEGAAAFFGEQIELRHPVCMHRGAEYCEIEILIS